MKWEKVESYTKRMRVPFGWIVKCYEDVLVRSFEGYWETGFEWSISVVFIPDPFHWWRL